VVEGIVRSPAGKADYRWAKDTALKDAAPKDTALEGPAEV
jgi:hypothetical protein